MDFVNAEDNRYSISTQCGCKIIASKGGIPLRDFCALVELWTSESEERWLIDGLLAFEMDVDLVTGSEENLKALKKHFELGEPQE